MTYVRLTDPSSGRSLLVPVQPAIVPGSTLRFYRGRPPQPPPPRTADAEENR